MKTILRSVFIIFLLATSCNQTEHTNERMQHQMDSLQQQLHTLRQEIKNERSNVMRMQDSLTEKYDKKPKVQKEIKNKPLEKQIETPKQNELPKPPSKPMEDNGSKYYYTGQPKRLSVEITPWNDGSRQVKFYNPSGQCVYTIDDKKMSYSSVTHITSFHPNGAANSVQTNMNPGASRYWYETTTTFDIDNTPLWQIRQQLPVESVSQTLNNKYFWNKQTQSWVKQEIIQEQSVPLRE